MKVMLLNLTKMVSDTGGLAKVTCNMANNLSERGYEISIVHSDENQGSFFYEIDKKVKVYNANYIENKYINIPISMKLLREVYRIFDIRRARNINYLFMNKYLKENIRRLIDDFSPDIIISSQTASTRLLIDALCVDIPIISMSHGDTEDYFKTYPVEEIPVLEKCDMCQVLLPSYKTKILDKLPNANIVVIPNVVPHFEKSVQYDSLKSLYKIIFVGRLTKNHKQPHLLIESFNLIKNEFPNWIVEIWGPKDGNTYYQYLDKLIKKYNLQDRVFLKGRTDNIESVLVNGDIFAFPSAYEGFPLALTEAMSIGLPSVAFKNCSGVNEIVKDGISGYLVDHSIESFANGLKLLMQDPNLREKTGKKARDLMKEFDSNNIWSKWERVIQTLLKDKCKL